MLQRVKEDRNILRTVQTRKANWIGHMLRRNCQLKHGIEGKIEGRTEMKERNVRRHQQLPEVLTGIWKRKN